MKMPPQAVSSKPRPSPAVSATALAVGVRKRGGDGHMWTVVETSAGTRRWQKATNLAKPATKKIRPTAAAHKIVFCEPYVVRNKHDLHRGSIKFTVSDKFYPTLLRAPRTVRTKRGENAYVFGRRFPLNSYEKLGYCGNDGAQIGFIDAELFDVKTAAVVSDIVLKEYDSEKRGNPIPWEDRSALRRLRKIIPHIIFMGGTDGGDVGATLYAHRSAGRIDGLIIDNQYYFHQS